MEELEVWAGRDENGELYLFWEKPRKGYSVWLADPNPLGCCRRLDDALFPEVQWSDEEPTKVKLVIEK